VTADCVVRSPLQEVCEELNLVLRPAEPKNEYAVPEMNELQGLLRQQTLQ
jgi:hypothetical protein